MRRVGGQATSTPRGIESISVIAGRGSAQTRLHHTVASGVIRRIEGLDEARRRAAHADLNSNMLGHVAAALQTGKTATAVQAIGAHLGRLAQTYGAPVSMPSAQPVPAQGGSTLNRL